MSRLLFEMPDVLRCAKHSLAAPSQCPVLTGFDQKTGKSTTRPCTEPALELVHDHGVYLMSNGSPRDLMASEDIVRENPPGEVEVLETFNRSFVAYAQGCDPTKQTFDEWWEESRRLVGGDDFAEKLEGWPAQIVKAAELGATQVVVTLTKRTLKLSFVYPPTKGAKP